MTNQKKLSIPQKIWRESKRVFSKLSGLPGVLAIDDKLSAVDDKLSAVKTCVLIGLSKLTGDSLVIVI